MAAIFAKHGNVFVRKADEKVMGKGIDLGKNDTLENYKERECTAEELAKYYPTKTRKHHKQNA